MKFHHVLRKTALAGLPGLALTLGACGQKESTPEPEPHGLRVEVSPLTLEGISDAQFELAVFNGADDLVWRKAGIKSTDFGNGKGDIVFIGTCDASSNDNRVELKITSLSANGRVLGATEWQNPTANGPLVQSFTCVENADAPVTFNVTVMRQANQGFFDIAVTFEDIFCSAKLDCEDDKGNDLVLLHDPATGERSTTVVMAFACTTGNGQTTWLHLNDVNVTCGDGTSYWIDPAGGPGNMGGQAPVFFQTASYRGKEGLPNLSKCYWNTALGVTEGPAAASCVLSGQGTATEGALTDGRTPANTAWPFVKWSVTLTDEAGQLACGRQALNAVGSDVTTDYTPLRGSGFSHSMECETTTITSPPRALCGGTIQGLNDAVAITTTAGGVSVSVGDQRSPVYVLDSGMDIGGCCLNPCCTTGDTTSE
ncbi:MAG: hypothetical protein JNJ59_11500 [Deltaproteobacteria bacterium]|jgi:hypothetical protein|nr:hypothetical protein [Deltaproteobacteria bacterium]